MKKTSLVSLLSILFLILSSLVAYYLKDQAYTTEWYSFFIGIGVMVIGGFLAAIFKRSFLINVLCFLLNAVALGFFIRAWYHYRNFDNSLITVLFVSLSCVVYLWFFFGLLHIPLFNRYYGKFLVVYLVLSFIGYLFLIVTTKTTYLSTFGFYMIVEIAFLFSLSTKAHSFNEFFRNILISSYSIVIVAIIVAAIILGGEAIDFDVPGSGGFELRSPKDQRIQNEGHP